MLIESVKKLSPLDRLLYWIQERESIRLKKEAGEPVSWTDDAILQKYRFCNVRRMDDKVSRWLLENWYEPYFDHPNMLVAAVMARHFNLPDCLSKLGFPTKWDPNRIKHTARKIKTSGGKVFSGAYMVRGMAKREPHWTACKSDQVIDRVCQPIVDNPPVLSSNSMREAVEALLPYWGFSSFMAGQVVADLRWAISGRWEDRMVWAPLGPGSKRGLNRLYGFVAEAHQVEEEFRGMLDDTTEMLKKKVPAKISSRLEAIDYQNCMCEFDKYSRALGGEGRPKQLYRGAT